MLRTLRGELRGFLEGNRVGHGGANPQRPFIEVGQELAADVRNQKQRGRENYGRGES